MTHLDDDLSDLLGGPLSAAPRAPVTPPATCRQPSFTEKCPKCHGSGSFISYSGRTLGPCFACKGKGSNSFKTSAADRAATREKVAERKARNLAADVAAFNEREPAVAAWIVAEMGKPQPFAFAVAMAEALNKFGDLTDRQLETCQRLAAKAAERATERAASRAAVAASAPAVDAAGIDRLKASFDQAVAYSAAKGLKLSPRITIGGMTISPAKATSANPGALYVKQSGGERAYLGKIAQGRFFASRECSPADAAKVQQFVADPAEAAKVYGQTTGTCCICNATLRSEWKNRGIGPICAEKFGW